MLPPEKLEYQIAKSTAAGREALEVWERVLREMSPEKKLEKAFELTELTRQTMRAGIRDDHPEATEEEIQAMYVDRLLSYHGTSLAEVRRLQAEELEYRRKYLPEL